MLKPLFAICLTLMLSSVSLAQDSISEPSSTLGITLERGEGKGISISTAYLLVGEKIERAFSSDYYLSEGTINLKEGKWSILAIGVGGNDSTSYAGTDLALEFAPTRCLRKLQSDWNETFTISCPLRFLRFKLQSNKQKTLLLVTNLTVPRTVATVSPTETALPPAPTTALPSATPVLPTATPLPPTATALPHTATDLPHTSTPLPPTATALPPAATPAKPNPTLLETEAQVARTIDIPPPSLFFDVVRFENPIEAVALSQTQLRQGPGEEYVVTTTLDAGSILVLTGQVDGWFESVFGGKLVYVETAGIQESESDQPLRLPTDVASETANRPVFSPTQAYSVFTTPLIRYTHSAMNLRQGPGTHHSRVGVAQAGARLEVLGQSGDWYVIDYNGTEAYIASWLTYDAPLSQPAAQQPSASRQQLSSPRNAPLQPAEVEQSPRNDFAQSPPQSLACPPGPRNVAGKDYAGNCTELREQGICGFPTTDPNWSRGRDRDKDGCACNCP